MSVSRDVAERAHAALAVGLVISACAGCTSEGRTEPGYGVAGCYASDVVCYGPEKVANLDVASGSWAYCATRPAVGFGQFGGYGRSESWFTWGADGAIEDVRVDCQEDSEVHFTGERDELGRMVAYHDSRVGSEMRLAYGDGDLPQTATSARADGVVSQTYAFEYEGATRLLGTESEALFSGSALEEEVALTYDGALVSSMRIRTTGAIECDQTVDLVRDAGRIVEIDKPGCGYGMYDATFAWEGGTLVRSTAETSVGITDSRYTFDDGRLTYLEEDRDGEPLTTAWYEYDAQGRLEHLVWWGHRMPEGQ